MKLYSMPGSGQITCAYVIAELGLDCEMIFTDSASRSSDQFRAISPYGRVPVLETDDGEAIFESLAITLYLLENDHGGKLAPLRDAPAHGRFLAWMAYLATTFYPVILRWHYPERYGEAESVRTMAEAEFNIIYDHIEREPHDWLVGNSMTIADVYLYMMMNWDEDRTPPRVNGGRSGRAAGGKSPIMRRAAGRCHAVRCESIQATVQEAGKFIDKEHHGEDDITVGAGGYQICHCVRFVSPPCLFG